MKTIKFLCWDKYKTTRKLEKEDKSNCRILNISA